MLVMMEQQPYEERPKKLIFFNLERGGEGRRDKGSQYHSCDGLAKSY